VGKTFKLKNSIYLDGSSLKSVYSSQFLVNDINYVDLGAIAPQTGIYDKTITLSVPTGYTPVGIIGYQITGQYSASVHVARFFISGNTFTYSVFNGDSIHTTASSTRLRLNILYAKN